MTLNCTQTKDAIIKCIKVGLTPFVQSSPGMGKSSIVREIAEEFNLCMIDYRISSADPTDFNGFPQIDKVLGVATYIPFDTFPIETTPLPTRLVDDGNGNKIQKAYDGWLLLMDELNHGNPSILRAAYKLILDRQIGTHKLHKNLVIVAAGNLSTDNAHTNKLGSALDSRVIQYQMHTDYKEWLDYANKNNFDYRITSFINYKPDALNNFTSDTPSGSFACQRTWEFTNRIVSKIPTLTPNDTPLIAGAIGEGMATEFVGFTRVFQDLPDINDILSSPASAKVPASPDSCYAVAGLLANHASVKNVKQIITYAKRLKTEFTVLTLKDAIRRTPDLLNSDDMNAWVEENMDDIII